MLPLRKQTLKKALRFGSSLLLFALVLTFFTTVFSPSANAANYTDKEFCEKFGGTWVENKGDNGNVISYSCTGAPTRLVSKFSPSEELTSFSLYTGIADCIGTRMEGGIQASASDNGDVSPTKWFNYGTFISIGDLYKTGDVYPSGEKKCDEMVTQALTMWGYGDDYSRFLRDMGYTFDSTTLKWTGSADGGTRYREFQDIVKNQVYATFPGSVPALSKAAEYLENLYFFQKSFEDGGCSAQDLGDYPSLGGVTAYKKWVDQNYITRNEGVAKLSTTNDSNLYGIYVKYSKIQIISDDRKLSQHGYAFLYGMTETNSMPIDLYAVQSSRVERSETCNQIAINISNFSIDYLEWLIRNPEAIVDGGGNACLLGAGGPSCPEEPATSCVVDGIGWIVCPLINAIGGVSDAMYGWIESILLLNPLQMNDDKGDETPQYAAWKSIRDISNVLLVVAFLLIIFSQITSIGVSNYGIKKLLPRVILVAILVNVSFIIMMIGIDVVNLIGKGLYDVLIGLAPDVTASSINSGNAIGSFITGILTGTLAGAGVTIAGGLIGAPALALMAVPFIVVAFLALFAAIATLFIRNALVILLVLVAPLALAAFLLPNTKSLFDRWRKLLVGILFLYPTAALLFGGAKFAAYTLANDDQPLSILVAVFVMAAPLGLLPWLASSSGGILGTIGGKLQGLAKSAKAPLQGALRSRVDNQRERYQAGQNTLFGRRRGQAEFDQRQIDTAEGRVRRNWGERLNQARTARSAETEIAKKAQAANVKIRGTRGSSARDQRFGGVYEQAERMADQEGQLKADYRQRVDRMIATPGTVDAQRQAGKFDAEQATKGYNATTDLRNQQRIINNVATTATGVIDATGAAVNLGDQATETYGVTEDIKAAEGDILRINRDSGVADVAVDRQKENAEYLKGLDADEQAEYDETLDTPAGAARRARAIATADSELTSSRVRGEVKADADARTEAGQPMFQEEMRRRAAGEESKDIAGRLQTFQEEASTNATDPRLNALDPATRASLQASAAGSRISGGALNSAQRVAQRQFDQDVIANPGLAAQVGGIDPQGIPRAQAEASQRERDAAAKAAAAEYELYTGQRYDPVELMDTVANGVLPNGQPANDEQIEAAINYVFDKGTVNQQMELADVLAGGEFHPVRAATPVEVQSGNYPTGRVVNPVATPGRTVPPRVLQALRDKVASSKLASVGGTRLNQWLTYNAGGPNPVPGYNGLILERMRGGRFGKEKFVSLDLDEMQRMARMAAQGQITIDPAATPAQQTEQETYFREQWNDIDDALGDEDLNKILDGPKRVALQAVRNALHAVAP